MIRAKAPVQRAAATRKAREFLTINANDDARSLLEAKAEYCRRHPALRAAKKRAQRDEANSAWDVARETFRKRVQQIVDRINKQPKVQGDDLLTLALAMEFDSETGARHALFKAIVLTAGGMRMKRERKRPGVTFVPSR